MIEALAAAGRDADGRPVVDKVLGMESRGFILGAPVALALASGSSRSARPASCPRATYAVSYSLEYGEATLEMHQDALRPATGCCSSTTCWPPAAPPGRPCELVEQCGATVHGVAMLMELGFLPGREALGDVAAHVAC